MPKSVNRSWKRIWCLLFRVVSYLLITFSSRIMIPSIQLNLRRSGCLKIMLMFCQYPDLNPIVNWWQFLKIQFWKRVPTNINNLKCRNFFLRNRWSCFTEYQQPLWGHVTSIIKKSSTGDSSSFCHSHRC